MFQIFTDFATWLVYGVFGLETSSALGATVHFFVEDVSKIFVLLVIYLIAWLRASLDVERVSGQE